MSAVIRKGWAFPGAGKKYHYFNNSEISLCRKWIYMPADSDAYDDTNHEHEDNCAACQKKKLAIEAKRKS